MKMKKNVVNKAPLRIYFKKWLLVSGQNFDNFSLSGGSGQLGGRVQLECDRELQQYLSSFLLLIRKCFGVRFLFPQFGVGGKTLLESYMCWYGKPSSVYSRSAAAKHGLSQLSWTTLRFSMELSQNLYYYWYLGWLLLGFYYTYWSYYTYCLIFFLIKSLISTGRSR